MTQSAAIDKTVKPSPDSTAAAIKERAADAIEKGVEVAQDTAAQAGEQAKVAAEQAKVVAERANDEIRKMTDSGAQFVRENPGAAIVGAVGVGILVGLALRGRD